MCEIDQLKKFIIREDAPLDAALSMIENNHKGFLLVSDNDGHLRGVLTDGDIRRHLIKHKNLDTEVIDACVKDPCVLNTSESIGKAFEVFRNEEIKFLPIVDDEKRIRNIITRKQLDTLLMQDIRFDLTYDFCALDESIVDTEIFHRPWGYYKTTMLNEYFRSKTIVVYPEGRLSLQYHNHREEYWIIVHGHGSVVIGESEKKAEKGDMFFIPCGVKHRISNEDEEENLIFSEVQIGDYFGEDDIIRIEDDYGRHSI